MAIKMATVNYNKAPPTFKKEDDFEKWKRKLDIWRKFTNIEKTKQGPALLLSLDDETQDHVLELPDSKIASDTGIEEILKILDSLYLKDKTQSHMEALDAWEDYRKDEDTSVKDFINEYDRRYNKIKAKGSSVSDDVLANKLLRAANLSAADRHLVKATVGQPFTYDKMKEQIKLVFQEDESPGKEDVKVESDETYYTNRFQAGQRRPFRGSGRGTYRPQGAYRPQGSTPRIEAQSSTGMRQNQLRGSNPIDQYGRISTCANCGSRNHWVNKCPDKKELPKATYLNQAAGQEEGYDEIPYEEDEPESYTYCSVTLFQTDYDMPKNVRSLAHESFNSAVIDCGASSTVCGQLWFNCFIDSLEDDWKKKVTYENSSNVFKFGDGRRVKSTTLAYIPATLGNNVVRIRTDVVRDDIPLLLSKHSLQKAKAEMNFYNNTINILGQTLKLTETASGHYILPLTQKKNALEALNRHENVQITLTCKNELTAKQKAIKLHRQFAHPSVKKLLKLIKTAGNDDEELEGQIKQVSKECEICRDYRRPPPRPVVGMPVGNDFNDCVAMDLKKFDNVHLLHVIDHVTRLSACAVIRNKKPATIIDNLFKIWIGIYGSPKQFLSDNGGEFNNETFRDLCEKLNVTVRTTAAESPWSNGICERHNAVLADMIRKVIHDTGCNIDLAVSWSVNAKNSLANVHGFSPYQLVFGKNPKLPNVLYDKPPALYNHDQNDIIRMNLNALHKAREAFMKSESSEKVRRALRHNVRSSGDVKYVTGDRVFYKRLQEKKWRGPATVLGQEGQQVLVKHGGVYVRVHPCRLSLEKQTIPWQNNSTDKKELEKRSVDAERNIAYDTSDTSDEEDENRTDRATHGEQGETADERTTEDNEQSNEHGNIQTPEDTDLIRNNMGSQNSQRLRSETTGEMRTQATPAPVTKLKRDMDIEFKDSSNQDWTKVKIHSRAGKAKGKYSNSWNVIDEHGKVFDVNLDGHVTKWRVAGSDSAEAETSSGDAIEEGQTDEHSQQTHTETETTETECEINL